MSKGNQEQKDKLTNRKYEWYLNDLGMQKDLYLNVVNVNI